jgi:predicted extracellular nuclease
MKNLFLILVLLSTTLFSFAQTSVTIFEIQGQTDASPYNNQEVTTHGVVTATYTDFYFIQDGEGAWCDGF